MTGKEFEKLMKDNGYTQTSLGERWGLVRQTIGNCCKAEKVDPLYADAIKALAFEKQAAEFLKVVQFFK
ncbi:MAG: hypothetical protein JKY54_09155 [Flavobacteriales bacterium]|jgi:DNA-binding XRE family transcriptional regulator|nr:hypothetical protein [Flavobacteriales bacterium]|tara:strand:- start:208 stop:414 length:207 start_codon:yes stop_codon:yes gene_type:complete